MLRMIERFALDVAVMADGRTAATELATGNWWNAKQTKKLGKNSRPNRSIDLWQIACFHHKFLQWHIFHLALNTVEWATLWTYTTHVQRDSAHIQNTRPRKPRVVLNHNKFPELRSICNAIVCHFLCFGSEFVCACVFLRLSFLSHSFLW